ncbi:reverse transcriptase domain-containing protein [Oleidesulfovibrio sp.]|uniref:reverse transcriptase domain-containing protein n=1 Tax=Oleidesulfovibrio sp. TaxID=2909707 RepID=UPI003A86AF40
MARTVKNLWREIATFTTLARAFQKVREGKRFDSDTLRFYASLEDNLFALEEALQARTWKPSPFREFTITVPKLRRIQAPEFGDRVVHQAVMLHASPVFERRFITDSYANRIGFGTHAASHRLREFLRSASRKYESPYIIKADISKYFPSIPHDRLMDRVQRLFFDQAVVWFFDTLIRNSGFTERGLPIGSLTSQWLANLYLDRLDHYMKDDLGVKYYVRYMDDFIIVGPDKTWCREKLAYIDEYVQGLGLALNPKTGVLPITQGVDFVGYRHWTDHVLPRKSTVKRARKQFKSLQRRYNAKQIDFDYVRSRVVSFTGYMKHCNGKTPLGHILDRFVLTGAGKQEKEE